METQFWDNELRSTISVSYFFMGLMFFFLAIGVPLRCVLYGWFRHPDLLFGLQFIPFGGILFVVVTMHLPSLRPHIYFLLCVGNFFIICWMAASVHLYSEEELELARGGALAEVFAVLQRNGDPKAVATLQAYVGVQLGRKYLWYALVFNYLQLDLLMFLGITWMSIFVFCSVPASLWIVAYSSPLLAGGVVEALGFSIVFVFYTLGLNYYMMLNRRRQFRSDHQLQRSLQTEAAALKEVAEQEAALKKASQEADTILNHVLKNVMADAAGCIYLYLQTLAPAGTPADLLQATECLERGIAWCRKRQALLRIAAGKYSPQLCDVDLVDFGHRLLQGRPIEAAFPDQVVSLDPLLCEIVLENALTNAHRHGHPTDPNLRFTATLTSLSHHTPGPRPLYRLAFTVANRANPARPPLTPELVARLLRGEAQPLGLTVPRLSEHLGMQHVCEAAHAHDMDVQLSQVGDTVYFEASLEVALRPFVDPVMRPGSNCPPAAVPPNLRVMCIDDSPVARRLLVHTLSAEPMRAAVLAFGETVEDVSDFLQQAVCGADIVILDHHLEYGNASFLGTDLLRSLLDRGYRGLICVRSANATPHDETTFIEAGAHCFIGKDLPPPAMVTSLMAAYQCRQPSPDTAQKSQSSLKLHPIL
eukprot:EG_transcript_5133